MLLPDPLNPESYNHRFVEVTSGQRYHLIDQMPPDWVGPASEAPTLLLTHGFPDLWYGWRYQIRAFAERGWRVICPSMLGYGESSKPIDLKAYGYKAIAYDMNSLLDQVGVHGKVVAVGHDWGGMAAWRFVNYFPHRVLAIACVCTPYFKPAEPSTPRMTDESLLKFLPNFGYQLYFQTPEAVPEMEEVSEHFLRPMHSASYRKSQPPKSDPGRMQNWVRVGRLKASIGRQIEGKRDGTLPTPPSEPEYDYYVKTYKKGGMAGPLSWYKTRNINHDDEIAAPLTFPKTTPALHLAAVDDAALPPSMGLSKGVLSCFPAGNLEVKLLEGADHWCLQDEKVRDKTTSILVDWIQMVLDGKWKPTGKFPALSKL